jgi:hypothetical protein
MNKSENMLHALFSAANTPETSSDQLYFLARHESEIIRGAVALNPSMPDNALDLLRNDKSSNVAECYTLRENFKSSARRLRILSPPLYLLEATNEHSYNSDCVAKRQDWERRYCRRIFHHP